MRKMTNGMTYLKDGFFTLINQIFQMSLTRTQHTSNCHSELFEEKRKNLLNGKSICEIVTLRSQRRLYFGCDFLPTSKKKSKNIKILRIITTFTALCNWLSTSLY